MCIRISLNTCCGYFIDFYTLYKRNGDIRILEENYEMMKKWYGYLERRARKSPWNLKKRFKRNPYRKYTIDTGIDYGAICGWLFDSVAGIQVENGRIMVCSHPNKKLGYATASYQSPYGKVISSWKYEGEKINYEITIPSNVKAKVLLPDGRETILEAGAHQL